MPAADRAALLDDALDLGTADGRRLSDLLTTQGSGTTGRTEAAITAPCGESGAARAAAGRHDAVDIHTGQLPRHRAPVTRKLSMENRIRMNENTEDVVGHAESVARSLAEFVTDLVYRGTGVGHRWRPPSSAVISPAPQER
ncbi:hypothetical protein ACIOTI_36455 [Streptomyces sp. NPDC087843]|uniref:hypothetical protein n=1 Tax=Streptomyces sp. NPDC087843 TaxID=3365804 RepID=UPI00381113F2